MQLAEAGRLDLDTPRLPLLKSAFQTPLEYPVDDLLNMVTVRQLLQHTV